MNDIIHNVKKMIHSLKEENGIYIFSFLFGMLGALIIFIMVHLLEKPSVQFGTINITGLVNYFVKQESNKNISPDQLKTEVKQFGNVLEKEIALFSKEKGVVLMISEAVASGAPDYTRVIYERIKQKREKHDESY